MNLKSRIALATLGLFLAAPAFAHHNESEGAGVNLFDRALALNNTVTYSALPYEVKLTVYRFVDEAFALGNCVTVASVEHERDSASATDHHNESFSSACASEFGRAHATWPAVEGYLSTRGDLVEVFRAYTAAREALLAIQ